MAWRTCLLPNINYREQLFWQSKGLSRGSLSAFIPQGETAYPSIKTARPGCPTHPLLFFYWCLAWHHCDLGSISVSFRGQWWHKKRRVRFQVLVWEFARSPNVTVRVVISRVSPPRSRQIFWAENAGETGGEGFFFFFSPHPLRW